MPRQLAAFAVLALVLLTQHPHAQGPAGQAQIYFIDVGQGAGTLIVSPAGKTLLVDGGPPGAGAKITSLLDAKGISQIDYTVVTHYHIDHMGGMIEVLNAGRVKNAASGGVAFDNGDAPEVQPPGTSTSATSTRGTYLNYIAATTAAGVGRTTVNPGSLTLDGLIDLGGGMRATFLAAGGRLLSGGRAAITNSDLNSESVSVLVEYTNFDYLVSGDLTGGGSTSTAKTPDVETYVGQMAGDVDVVQLNHHGSTTTSNQVFLSAVKAEVAVAQTGETNTFGHPNRETVNKYLNTPTTSGSSYTGTGVSTAVGVGPVFYQNEASPSGDERVTQQGYTAAAPGSAGHGTLLLTTDGITTYSLSSFDDGGVRVPAAVHTYSVDGASAGTTTDFKPTVIPRMTPANPLASDPTLISALVNDRESPIGAVTLAYSVNGVAQAPIPMTLVGGRYEATIPAQGDGARVDYAVTATSGAQTTTYTSGYFSGVTPIATIRTLNAKGEPLYAGYAARVQGTVTASGFSPGTNDDYIQDGTGAVNVYRSTDTPTPFTTTVPGQVVDVNGLIGFNGGRLRLDITDSVEKTTSSYGIVVLTTNPAPTPVTTTLAALAINPEALEGQFVSVANCTITAGTIPATPQPVDTFVTVSDGTGSFLMKIDHDTDVEGFTPVSPFTLTGIVQQDDFLRPFDSNYDIAPRSRVDLGAAAPAPAPLLTIAEARVDEVNNVDDQAGADFVPDRLNEVVRIRGTVTSIDFRGGNGIEYYVQDASAGIDLFNSSTNFGPFGIGDTVEAIGTITQFFGLTELTVSSVSLVSSQDVAPAPQTITLGQLSAGGGEAFEGRLVRVDGATITDTYPVSGSSKAVSIADATGTGQIFIDSDTDIDGTAKPGGTVSITGLLGQHATAAPLDNSYQIVPRFLADIVVTGGAGPALIASPATLTFAATAVGSASIAPVTITNNGTSTLTLTTPFTITDTDAAQFQVGAPTTTALAAGGSTTVTVTFAPTTGGGKSATLNITSDQGSTTVALVGTATVPGAAATVVISEIRFRGPLGGNDEFVEIYNNSDSPADISGWKLMGSSNTAPTGTRATVPANVVLPGRTHYLFVNATPSTGYSGTVPGNLSYTTGFGDNGGAALTKPDGTIVDQVGVATINTAYREGSPIATQLTTNVDRGYERKPGGLSVTLQDTDDNATDFQLTAPTNPQDLVLTASPGSVNFGSVAPGDSRTITVSVKNVLASAVTLNAPSVTGADPAVFSAGAPSTTALAAGATATIAVTFQPADSGARSAALTVTSSSAGTVAIPLSGTGSGGLSVSPSTIDFGTVAPGASAAATVTITNTDATGVTLSPPFAITGPNADDFGVGAPAATTIDGGANTTVPVAFQPLSAGLKNASLVIATSTGTTRTVALTGVGTCPAITVAGALPAGFTGVPYSGAITASGGDAPYTFTIATGTPPSGLTLSTGGALTGTPTTTGAFTFGAQATATNGCTGIGSFTVTITPPPVVVTAAPDPVDFGLVAAGSTATQTVTITNVSATPIVLAALTISGADAARFSVGAAAAATLVPGASTTAPVTFAPAVGGARRGTLTVSTTGGASTTAALTGIGTVATPVVISEFRFRGPAGGNDEFVEIANNTSGPLDISGYTVRGSNNAGTNSVRATVPLNTMLPAHAHYLFVNAGAAGYSGAVPGNLSYSTGITDDGGVAIADAHGAIVDQVGLSAGSLYKEGAVLASLGTTNADKSYARKIVTTGGALQDSDDNATDFVATTPSDPQDLPLTATPARIDFGSLPTGDTASATVTLRNMLLSPLTLTTVSDAAPAFAVAAPAATTLAAGATTTIAIAFHPVAALTFEARVQVDSDHGAVTFDLTGVGRPGITVTPVAIDFGSVEPGASTSADVTIVNDDTVTIAVNPPAVTAGAPDFAVSTPATLTLTPTASTTATVTFASTSLGAKTGTVTVSSVNGGTRTVTLNALVACPAITVNAPLPPAEYGFAYSQVVTASGGTGPYAFSAVSGTLPPGLALTSAGVLAGTPTALGAFPFTVEATAANGCRGTATVTVSVNDTTPPVLTLPGNIAATATTPAGAAVPFVATATDLVDGGVTPSCAPASGATFPIGATTVSCTATDAHGNAALGSFVVTVTTVTVPGRMTGDARIESATVEHDVAFLVQERTTGADAGALSYRATPRAGKDRGNRFESTAITSVSFFDVPGVTPGRRPPTGVDTVSFSGVGRWNDRAGYTFDAVAVDRGEPGRDRDRFTITIRDAAGEVVASVDSAIADGNIQSLRMK